MPSSENVISEMTYKAFTTNQSGQCTSATPLQEHITHIKWRHKILGSGRLNVYVYSFKNTSAIKEKWRSFHRPNSNLQEGRNQDSKHLFKWGVDHVSSLHNLFSLLLSVFNSGFSIRLNQIKTTKAHISAVRKFWRGMPTLLQLLKYLLLFEVWRDKRDKGEGKWSRGWLNRCELSGCQNELLPNTASLLLRKIKAK